MILQFENTAVHISRIRSGSIVSYTTADDAVLYGHVRCFENLDDGLCLSIDFGSKHGWWTHAPEGLTWIGSH